MSLLYDIIDDGSSSRGMLLYDVVHAYGTTYHRPSPSSAGGGHWDFYFPAAATSTAEMTDWRFKESR